MTQGIVGREDRQRLIRMTALTAPGRCGWALGLVAVMLLGLGWTRNGHGAPGDLDPTFGGQGLVTTTVSEQSRFHALVLQPDGRLVGGGSSFGDGQPPAFTLARYQPDGQLDPTFGTDGVVTTHLGTIDFIRALVLQPDGMLVAAGTFSQGEFSPESSRLARYASDGRLDPAFGDAGIVTLTLAGWAPISAGALIRQPDGTLVMAGSASACPPCSGVNNALLVRFQPDGQLDPTFGTGGVVITDFGGDGDGISALVLQPDGRLVAAGGANENFALARYQPDGQLDAAFGTGGLVTTDLGGSADSISALVLQPDNRLVAAGSAAFSDDQGFTQVFALARYQTLDVDVLAAFVTEVYLAALARPPDALEETYWVEVLATEPTPDTVHGMLHVLFDGPEFRQRPVNPWQYVDALYRAMLGREPEQAELDWWVQAVLDRLNTLLPELIGSPEFQHLVPSCQDQAAVTLLVGRLYQHVLKRVPSLEEVDWWTTDIVTWCALQDAVEVFFNSLEYLSEPRTLADHVTVVYRALLAHEPDAGGLTWWVDDLAGQLTTIEDDVMASPEFEARVDRLFP